MCGIAGIVGLDPQWMAEEQAIRQMCRTLVHRGPDDEGVYVRGAVGLGMRRLSIIDLAGGRQPIHNEDQTVWVVLNGEIYNFPELRAGLERSGHRFYTQSDTEVIVHLYEELGARCVEKLRGMFAVALYDEAQHRLVLARDRFGKKPLHYALHDGKLIFASEIKALLAVAPELAEVNREGVLQYLYFGFVPDPLTAFKAVQKLPPAHRLELHNGKVRVARYWDLPRYGEYNPPSEEAVLAQLEAGLDEAVRIRLISDVPLGALLSGGIDSSTVVALMRRASSGPVKTFSITFRDEEFNEASHARAVARRFETEHTELTVEPNIWETVEALSRSLEEPFGDSSVVPQFYVSRLTRQYVTVALSGDGGDELFAGYTRFQVQLRRTLADWIPGWLGNWYRTAIHPRLANGVPGRRLLFNLSLGTTDRYLDSVSYLPVERERALFTSEFLEWAASNPSPYDAPRQIYRRAPANDPLSRLLYLDAHTNLPGDILTKVDRMSMAASLEMRSPLLDHVLAEWVARLSPQWKLRDGRGKYLLRRLALRLGVPRSVLERPKRGFALPLVNWFRSELKAELAHILLEPRTLQRGYLDRRGVECLLEEHFRSRRNYTGTIWLLLMLELWHRNFLGQPRPLESATAALRASGIETDSGRTAAVTPVASENA